MKDKYGPDLGSSQKKILKYLLNAGEGFFSIPAGNERAVDKLYAKGLTAFQIVGNTKHYAITKRGIALCGERGIS